MPLNETFPTIHLRDYPEYTPRNTLELTLQSAAVSAGFGVLAAAIKNSLRMGKGHIGALHPQTGFLTFLFAASGSAFTFGEAVSTNLREKEDGWNTAAGGALAGAVIGATYKTLPKVLGFSLLTGSALGIYEWSGGVLGYGREDALKIAGDITDLADKPKQGFWEVVQRRPLSQTVDELGDLVRPFK